MPGYADTHGLHTTEHELDFIKKLDSFGTEIPYEDRLTKKQLLVNYHKALKKRTAWGSIDGERVMNHLFQLIYAEDLVNK